MTQVGGGTPSRQIGAYWGGPIPWASVKDFVEGGSEILTTQETITERGLRASASNLIPPATPLVCTRMAVGRSAMAPMPVAINQDVKALFPARGTTGEYLLRLLAYIQPTAEANAVGSTVKGIRVQDYLSISVPIGPASDQPRIVAILDTLDTAIRQTEAIIEKLKLVKQGLLHDLLTRGIDDNGELRPPQSEAPHLYKKSALGWIPRDWLLVRVDEACSDVVDCPHSTPNFRDDGVLVARTMHIKSGTFLEHIASRVSEAEYHDRITRLRPEAGDVIFTREAPVGEAFMLPVGMQICLGQRVMLLRPKYERMRGEFLVAQVYSGAIADRIAALTAGTTNPHLNVAEVRRFLVPLPPVLEQAEIGRRLFGLGARIESEVAQREKLLVLKSGLMDDLLTGCVRVTALLEQATIP